MVSTDAREQTGFSSLGHGRKLQIRSLASSVVRGARLITGQGVPA